MVSVVYGLAEVEEPPQLDWTNGPLTITGLSGCSRAAFRGLMELKQTPDRQPVNPREAKLESSASTSSNSEDRGKHRDKRDAVRRKSHI